MFEKEAEEYATRDVFFDGVPEPVINYQRKEDWQKGAEFGYNKVKKELEEERKLNAEIKARFVKCNTCTDEMKSKCLMFTENLCEGERCEELIDIVSLVNKSDLERKIEVLEKANEWHYPSKGELPKEDKRYLCKIKAFVGSGITYECFDYDSEYSSWKGASGEVIAWKEIVLPELKESK